MGQRYLYLMRHGVAESNTQKTDFERGLTEVGQRQILRQVAQFKQKDGIRPDGVLCSTARRAVQTAEVLQDLFKGIPFFFRETLYLAPTYRIMNLIRETDDLFARILIIGHNPGIEQFVGILDKKHIPVVMHPATCVCMQVQVQQWRDIQPETAQVEKIFMSGT